LGVDTVGPFERARGVLAAATGNEIETRGELAETPRLGADADADAERGGRGDGEGRVTFMVAYERCDVCSGVTGATRGAAADDRGEPATLAKSIICNSN
jgi:hypothetical protein